MYKNLLLGVLLTLPLMANETSEKVEKRFEQEKKPISTFSEKRKPFEEKKFNPEEAKKINFSISKLKIQKSNVFSEKELINHFKHILNKEITLYDLIVIVNELTQKYYENDYPLSKAYLPVNQEIYLNAPNTIKINLIEPFLDDAIKGINDKRMLIVKMKNNVFPKKEIKSKNLEEFLSLTKKISGIPSLILDKSEIRKASSLITEQKTLSGFISIDNRGTKAVGEYQFVTGLSIKNPFGYLSNTDLLYARSFDSKELDYFSLTNNFLLNEKGLNFSINTTYSNSEPGIQALRSIDQKSKSKSLNLKLNQPIISSREENLDLSIKLDMRNSESLSLDSKISEDKTRVLRAELNYDFSDENSVNQIILEYSKGLTILGSIDSDSSLKSRADAEINFDKLNIFVSRTQKLTDKFSLYGALNSQLSADPLLSGEECGIGGKQFGRAYDSSEITGDTCYSTSLELRYVLDDIGKYHTYTFYDIGKAKNKKTATTNLESESIASAGLGFRFYPSKNFYGSFEIAKPLTKIVANENNRDARIFASLTYRF